MSSYVEVEYHWAEPDPDIVAQQVISIANQLDDLVEPMAIAGGLTRADIQENFDTETDPSGAPWQPHADSYEPYALAFGSGQILNLTGELKSAATSAAAFVPTNEGLFINTGGFPEWWAWNNFGAERTVAAGGQSLSDVQHRARQIVIREHKSGNKISGKTAMSMARGEFSGGNELPARPFIGLSPEARVKIDAAFALWFEGSIALGISSGGKAFGQHRKRYPKGTPGGLGGRFMPRGS